GQAADDRPPHGAPRAGRTRRCATTCAVAGAASPRRCRPTRGSAATVWAATTCAGWCRWTCGGESQAPPAERHATVALDPGVRTFLTGYDADGALVEWGVGDMGRLT